MLNAWLHLQTPTTPPETLHVVIDSQSGSSSWFIIPLATVLAAITASLIAGTFLTFNEHLKRKREDRRQWDKEIRDLCVEITTVTTAIRDSLWTAATSGPPKQWVDEYLQEFSLPERVDNSHQSESDLLEQAYRMEVLHPSNLERLHVADDLIERLSLIAAPLTIKASEELQETTRQAVVELHDGLSTKIKRQNISWHSTDFIGAVKRDLRI